MGDEVTEIKRNKRFIKVWIKALRSGKYKQATGRLENESGYCCLGVACKISSKTERCEVISGYVGYRWRGNVTPEKTTLPPRMRHYIGITSDEEQTLVELNDSGRSFKVIADKLEKMIQ